MIKFDFFTNTEKFLSKQELANLLDKKPLILEKFNSSNMVGWLKRPDDEVLEKIDYLSKK